MEAIGGQIQIPERGYERGEGIHFETLYSVVG